MGIVPFKTISIISLGKAFCRQRIPQSNCAIKDTAGKDIFTASKNGNRKIMLTIRIISGSPTQISNQKLETVRPVQMNI